MGDSGRQVVRNDGLPTSPDIFVPQSLRAARSGRAASLQGAAVLEGVCLLTSAILLVQLISPASTPRQWRLWLYGPSLQVAFWAAVGLPLVMVVLLPRGLPRRLRTGICCLTAAALVVAFVLAAHRGYVRGHVRPRLMTAATALVPPRGLVPVGGPVSTGVPDRDGVPTGAPEVRWFWRSSGSTSSACLALEAAYRSRPGWLFHPDTCTAARTVADVAVFLSAGRPGTTWPRGAGVLVTVMPAAWHADPAQY